MSAKDGEDNLGTIDGISTFTKLIKAEPIKELLDYSTLAKEFAKKMTGDSVSSGVNPIPTDFARPQMPEEPEFIQQYSPITGRYEIGPNYARRTKMNPKDLIIDMPEQPLTTKERQELTRILNKVSASERNMIVDLSPSKLRGFIANYYTKNPYDDYNGFGIPTGSYQDKAIVAPAQSELCIRELEAEMGKANLEAERFKKLNETLKDKAQEMASSFVEQITERDDYIKQISEQAMGVGIVIKTFPNAFTAQDFEETDEEGKTKLVDYVRVLRGQYAGKIAKLNSIDVDDEMVSRATVEFNDGNVAKYIIDRKANVAVPIVNTDEDQNVTVTENPHPQLYRPGTVVMLEGDVQATVLSRVNNSGDIMVIDSAGNPSTIFVGYDEFIAPVNQTAGVVYCLIKGEILPVNLPQNSELAIGDKVLLSGNGQIVQTSIECPVLYGDNVTFKRMLSKDVMEVDSDGKPKLVHSVIENTEVLEKGTRIVLDSSNQVALISIETEQAENTFTDETGVSWDDIGGAYEAKEALRDAIESPILNAELYKRYNKKPPKGVLLYGPPGTGKTMLAKAAATSMKAMHGNVGAETAYIYQKGPEVLSQWVGVAEQKIRAMFQQARDHKEKYGYPAILFIDEADAILSKRGSSRSSDVDKTIVPAFLAEMDGLEDSGCILVLATNRPDSLDEAVVRMGRVDRKIKVCRPDANTAKTILKMYLKKVPISDSWDLDELTNQTIDLLYHEDLVTAYIKLSTKMLKLTQGMLTNGATLAGLVDIATSNAMKRDIATGTFSGVCFADLKDAVREVFTESMDMNHDNDIQDLVGDKVKDIQNIQYAKELPIVLV